jgi:hypothetical protein
MKMGKGKKAFQAIRYLFWVEPNVIDVNLFLIVKIKMKFSYWFFIPIFSRKNNNCQFNFNLLIMVLSNVVGCIYQNH